MIKKGFLDLGPQLKVSEDLLLHLTKNPREISTALDQIYSMTFTQIQGTNSRYQRSRELKDFWHSAKAVLFASTDILRGESALKKMAGTKGVCAKAVY